MEAKPFSLDALLGQGWSLPVRVDGDGDIALVAGADAVAQSIWSILGTAPGERVAEPEYGCGIHELVFAPGDGGTAALVAEHVERALAQWEPRMELVAVRVEHVPEKTLMHIDIEYGLRSAPGIRNLVFPFYLEGTP